MNTQETAATLSALANDVRLQIFRTLSTAAPVGLTAGQLAEQLGISPSNLTFHLKEMKAADLVLSEKKGRYVQLTANVPHLTAILTDVVSTCCAGHPEQCGIDVRVFAEAMNTKNL